MMTRTQILCLGLIVFLFTSCSKNNELGFNEALTISETIESLDLTNVVRQIDLPDYIIDGNIEVNGDLHIEPGVRIEFTFGSSLIINDSGSIRALGARDSTVIFTGMEDRAGYWKGILINSMNVMNEFSHSQILYAGGDPIIEDGINAAINCKNARIFISNTKIMDTEGYGMIIDESSDLKLHEFVMYSKNSMGNIMIHPNHLNTLDQNSIYKNENGNDDNILVTGGEVNNEIQLDFLPGDVAYLVTEDINFNNNLKLNSGVKILMDPETRLYVNQSALKIIGTADEPVIIKGKVDDQPSWKGIVVNSSTVENEINYLVIENAGSNKLDPNWLGDTVAAIGLRNNARLKVYNTSFLNYNGCKVYLRANAEILHDASILESEICN